MTYDVELENTLKNMKDNSRFLKTNYDRERGWMWNGHHVKMLGGTKVETDENKYKITPVLQKLFTDSSYKTAKSMNDMEKLVFRDILQKN